MGFVPQPILRLKDFPGDWCGYDALVIELENLFSESLRLTVRVHDRQHETGARAYGYSDRFNQSFLLTPGGHRLAIPLDEIQQAPISRDMDLKAIVNLTIFIADLKSLREIRINRVYLHGKDGGLYR